MTQPAPQPQSAPQPQPVPHSASQFPQPPQPTSAYGTPMQNMAPPARPNARFRTKRGLLKYIFLGIITLGIYDIWQMSEVTDTLNLIATRRDGKRTMHFCLMFFLVGWLTLGIGWLVWFHRMSGRIGEEQAARGLPVTVTSTTYWLWYVLGCLIIVGPWVYTYKMLHAMNDLSADYNARG